jgi:excisionase family DNA binding protein
MLVEEEEMRQSKPPLERLAYSIPEACVLIGVSRPTLYRRISDGDLRTVMFGGRRLVPHAALLELLGESDAT